MTPEQVGIVTAIATIIKEIGTWKLGSLIAALLFGPWITLGVVTFLLAKWFKGMEEMYKNNVTLVKNYESITKDHKEMIIYNTQIMTEVKQTADNNLFCPVNRDRIQQREVREIKPI